MALHRSTSLMRGLPCTLLPGPSSFVRQPLFCSSSIRQRSFRSGSARRQICRAGEPQHRENPARGQEVFRHFTDHSIRAILSSQREAEALRDVEVILCQITPYFAWSFECLLSSHESNLNQLKQVCFIQFTKTLWQTLAYEGCMCLLTFHPLTTVRCLQHNCQSTLAAPKLQSFIDACIL